LQTRRSWNRLESVRENVAMVTDQLPCRVGDR
jgi:hypothetical protein